MSEPCCASPALLPPLAPTVDGFRGGRLLDAVARVGTVVTLLAVIVLGAAVGSSLGGAAGRAPTAVTFDR